MAGQTRSAPGRSRGGKESSCKLTTSASGMLHGLKCLETDQCALSYQKRGRDLRRLLGIGLDGIRTEYDPEEGERAYAVLLGRPPSSLKVPRDR